MKLSQGLAARVRELVSGRLGLDFPEGRQADLERGFLRSLRGASASDPGAYVTWLATLPDEAPEWGWLAGHLTVGETYFFRDAACFEAVEREILTPLIAARRAEGRLRLRLWSAGCATGEEPYSLAILLDRLLPDRAHWALTILATDINPEAMESAQVGRYRDWALRETPAGVRDRYFRRRGGETFELDPGIRSMVAFAPLNLAGDGYPTVVTNTNAMDLIFCRNVLMYFNQATQRAVVPRLQGALMDGGWLVVSAAEASAELFHPLRAVTFSGAIFYRKENPAAVCGRRSAVVYPLPCWEHKISLPEIPAPRVLLECPTRPAAPDTRRTAPTVPEDGRYLHTARALANEGKLDEARHLCEAALARDRLDPEAYSLLAAICQERGEALAALEALRRAIYLAPDFAPAHFLLGTLLLQHGDRARGRRSLEAAIGLLGKVPRDEVVPGADGLTAGRLLETAREYLTISGAPPAARHRQRTADAGRRKAERNG